MAGLVDKYCENLALSLNILFSPSLVIESFAGYSSLLLHPWTLTTFRIYIQDLLALRVSMEKSGVILIGLPLYFTCPFPSLLLIFFLYLLC